MTATLLTHFVFFSLLMGELKGHHWKKKCCICFWIVRSCNAAGYSIFLAERKEVILLELS